MVKDDFCYFITSLYWSGNYMYVEIAVWPLQQCGPIFLDWGGGLNFKIEQKARTGCRFLDCSSQELLQLPCIFFFNSVPLNSSGYRINIIKSHGCNVRICAVQILSQFYLSPT